MSLFENDEYRWRETYFVLFHEENRPSADAIVAALYDVDTDALKQTGAAASNA